MIKILKTTAFVFLFAFSLAVSAHNSYPAPNQALCPYNHGSVCVTYTGNVCRLFIPNYQNNWFSACLYQNFFHACLNSPYFPSPWIQNACYPKGAPCTCSFGAYNGYYFYEPGQVF